MRVHVCDCVSEYIAYEVRTVPDKKQKAIPCDTRRDANPIQPEETFERAKATEHYFLSAVHEPPDLYASISSNLLVTIMMSKTSIELLLFSVVLISLAAPSFSYASWLKCFIEMDPSEVIMWNKVVPASDSKHDVRIEVQPYGFGDNWLSASSEDGTVQLPPSHPEAPLTLKVRLAVPPALQREDVQFVIEAKTSAADMAAEAVEFIDRGVMCDGSRAFSRRHDEHVILQVHLASHPSLEYVALTAAWAPGMEAVTLTPTLILQPSMAVVGKSGDEL